LDPEPTSLLILMLNANVSFVSGLILLFILLFCSALISGVEVAFFSLSKSDIDLGLDNNSKKFSIIAKLLERPKKLLATILVANNFINIGIGLSFSNKR